MNIEMYEPKDETILRADGVLGYIITLLAGIGIGATIVVVAILFAIGQKV
jgi:hypothetical protein